MIFDFVFCFIILIFGYRFIYNFKLFTRHDVKIIKRLYFYHLLVGLGFYLFIIKNGGDSTNYWFATYDYRFYDFEDVWGKVAKGSATGYLLLINYIPAKVIGLSFFSGSILYTVIGFLGFIYFYALIKSQIPNIYYLKKTKVFGVSIFPFMLFLPNLHFWSSGVGKDTLLFFCIALFFYSSIKASKSVFGLIISIGLSFVIRPHITLFMIMALGLGVTFDGRLKSYQKVIITTVFAFLFASAVNYVMNFVQLDSFDSETVGKYSDTRSSNLSNDRTSSSIDTSNYSYPLKVFTFLFRPLFFDANGILGLVASFENLFLLFFLIKILKNRFLKGFNASTYLVKASAFLFIMGALSFSLILGNLGIMLRQKTPFIMMLIIFGFAIILSNKQNKLVK